MSKIIKGSILLWLFISQGLTAQNYQNTPYSRYALGDLINDGFSYNRSLGGSSIALRPQNQINYLNPASFTAQDTNSFLLHTGVTGRYGKIQTANAEDKTLNFNLDYFAMGFPLTRWWNMSAGLVPYSRVEYTVYDIREIPEIGNEKMTYLYHGEGGYNDFYIGTAFQFGDFASIGANAKYLFGSTKTTQFSVLSEYTNSTAVETKTTQFINDFHYTVGTQIHPLIRDKHRLVIGATYDFTTDITTKLKEETNRTRNLTIVDSVDFDIIDTLPVKSLPNKLGLGLSYNYDDILMLTAEYTSQDWTGTDFERNKALMTKYESYRFGVEYVPVPLKSRARVPYYKRIRYRAGGHYTKSYLSYNSNNISSYGLSAGIGLPWKYAKKMFTSTTFNIGYQYNVRGTTDNNLIKEDSHILTIGLTLHDFWFLKPKYN